MRIGQSRAARVYAGCIAVALAGAMLAGCRGGSAGSGPRVGPSLGSLVEHLRDPQATPEKRQAYLERHAGKLVSGNGVIVELSDCVLLECTLDPPHQGTAFLKAYPQRPEELASLKTGQKLGALGVLQISGTAPEKLGTREAPFVIREARLRIR